MSWFWGKKKQQDDNDEEEEESFNDDEDSYDSSSSSEEEASGDEEVYSSDDEQQQEVSPKQGDEEGLSRPVSANSLADAKDLIGVAVPQSHTTDPSDDEEEDEEEEEYFGGGGASTVGYDDYSTSNDDDDETDEEIRKGVIPENLQRSNRVRADSAISIDEDMNGIGYDNSLDQLSTHEEKDSSHVVEDESSFQTDGEEEEEEEGVTSIAEKQSILVLAAENDRVDILQAILNDDSTDSDHQRDVLLREGIPPLHIAVSYGSVNATNCLMRMGADPSLRPNVAEIQQAQKQKETPPVDIPNMGRFDGVTAWELAFGDGSSTSAKDEQRAPRSWSLFGGSSSNIQHDQDDGTDPLGESLGKESESSRYSTSRRHKRRIKPVDMPPSKREGIRHAFTAEALRCIGSDEVHRLEQLLNSGMPASVDIGGKNLYEWAVEMGSLQCEELMRPAEAAKYNQDANDKVNDNGAPVERKESAVLERRDPGAESIAQLANRLDELDSLSKALSVSLDGLAEEVSVCNGLLLMGGGASALATHVRSLKQTKDRHMDELVRIQEAWENSEDELMYWAREAGPDGEQIANQVMVASDTLGLDNWRRKSVAGKEGSDAEEDAQKRQLKAQIAASEQRIRKLRASIADLSEALARDLEEVEKRGLSGGINLVRGLRDEIREIEFQLSEVKSAEATCRTKINLIQSKLSRRNSPAVQTEHAKKAASAPAPDSLPVSSPMESPQKDDTAPMQDQEIDEVHGSEEVPEPAATNGEKTPEDSVPSVLTDSERIATGQSTALTLRSPEGSQGYLPTSLWRILLRIIGLGDTPRPRPERTSSSASNPPPSHPVMLI